MARRDRSASQPYLYVIFFLSEVIRLGIASSGYCATWKNRLAFDAIHFCKQIFGKIGENFYAPCFDSGQGVEKNVWGVIWQMYFTYRSGHF
jgi:hypothetical protein